MNIGYIVNYPVGIILILLGLEFGAGESGSKISLFTRQVVAEGERPQEVNGLLDAIWNVFRYASFGEFLCLVGIGIIIFRALNLRQND